MGIMIGFIWVQMSEEELYNENASNHIIDSFIPHKLLTLSLAAYLDEKT